MARTLITGVEELKDLVAEMKQNVKENAEGVRDTLLASGYTVDATDAGIARVLAKDVLSKVFSNADVRAAVEKAAATLLSDTNYLSSILPVEQANVDAEEVDAEQAEEVY